LILIAIQVIVIALIILGRMSAEAPAILTEEIIDYGFTAGLFLVLTLALYRLRSRLVAVLLLVLTVVAQGWQLSQGQRGGIALLISLWGAIRSIQATVKFHSFTSGTMPVTAPVQVAPQPSVTKNYDVEKWEALVKYDAEIAVVAEILQPLGEKWMDEFARSYLALNDKQYLECIARRIIADAQEERDRGA
jgi:hypothetical protein